VSHPLLLAIDVGNTNVSLGVFDYASGRGELVDHWRLGTHREQTSDEVGVFLRVLFAQSGCDPSAVTDVILSSVVPPLAPIWERVCRKLFGRPPMVVGPGIKTGMPVRYENPREVGADRIVNAVAAFELVGGPVIAVDFGTATTFDCISERGEYLGGAIFPGIHIAMEALFDRASMLHRVEITRPRSVIGRTTTASLQSGLLFGYAGLVDAMVERIRGELGAHARVVATGGLAQRIANETKTIERVEPFLTLEGLRLLFEKNRGSEPDSPRKEK
jgi:type III pantothenate kinase